MFCFGGDVAFVGLDFSDVCDDFCAVSATCYTPFNYTYHYAMVSLKIPETKEM